MIEFKMPALGSDMDEGTLNEWLVKPGDKVTRGQVVAVVETTKAAVEIECWQEGTVHELLVPIGETVQVGTALATLLAPGETRRSGTGTTARTTGSTRGHRAGQARDRDAAAGAVAPTDRPAAPSLGITGRAPPRPTLGVDIDTVTGTGPQGAVTISDVEHAAAAQPAKEPARPSRAAADRAAQMRKSIAAAMSRSKREIPHYYLADEITLEKALTWLTERNAQRSDHRTGTAGRAAVEGRRASLRSGSASSTDSGETTGSSPRPAFTSASAISLRGGGLVAPAIHDVADKKLDELMDDLTDLVARARAGSLRSSEMSDPTITVTNLGDKGVDAVFGVIYPPQVALVGFRPAGTAGLRRSTAESGSSPPCRPRSPPTTGPATVTAARCSSPRSTSCSSSPTSWKSECES